MARATVIVPPFLKIAYGPLLGPAMLVGAGRRAGHEVRVLDLNARWITQHLPTAAMHETRRFVGDHDRPRALSGLHEAFKRDLGLQALPETHEGVLLAAGRLAESPFGAWIAKEISMVSMAPDAVGLSVMYRDQVEPALAITLAARRLWPNALIVWGGAHVTALRDEIARDERYGCKGSIDRFVFGYAERTWVEFLDAIATRTTLPDAVMQAGHGPCLPAIEDGSVVPVFDDISDYDASRLTIPLQSSRGCGYGVCAHCTYPSIEGPPRDLPWEAIEETIEYAVSVGASLSFKDSLLAGGRLEAIATRIAGRTRWSACTKLDAKLPGRLARLAAGGCATLEIGLETIDVEAQRMLLKRQSETVFHRTQDAAAAAGVALVVNYMTDLPYADVVRESRGLQSVTCELERRRPQLVAVVERNRFQLERLSPMGRAPKRFGIRVTRHAPWTSVLAWELGL